MKIKTIFDGKNNADVRTWLDNHTEKYTVDNSVLSAVTVPRPIDLFDLALNSERLALAGAEAQEDIERYKSEYKLNEDDARMKNWAKGGMNGVSNIKSIKKYFEKNLITPEVAEMIDKVRAELSAEIGKAKLSLKSCKIKKVPAKGGRINARRYKIAKATRTLPYAKLFDRKKQEGQKREIKLAVNLAVSCFENWQTNARTVARGLALHEIAVKLGYSCSLSVVNMVKPHELRHNVATICPVLKAGDRMDAQRLGALAMVASYRSIFMIACPIIHKGRKEVNARVSSPLALLGKRGAGFDAVISHSMTEQGLKDTAHGIFNEGGHIQ